MEQNFSNILVVACYEIFNSEEKSVMGFCYTTYSNWLGLKPVELNSNWDQTAVDYSDFQHL